jgi:hypothetical protein
VNSTNATVAQQYLAGVLELPTVWQESGYISVFNKILDHLICVLKDLGLESDEDKDKNVIIFDEEGIDSIVSAILVGISDWRPADPESEHWYRGFAEIVRLLCLHVLPFLIEKS